MGLFGDAIRGANISSEVNEADEDLVASITRLVSIVDTFISSYGDIVIEVLASPLDIVQRKMNTIDELIIYVVYNQNADANRVEEAKDMLNALVDDEFNEIKNGVNISFDTKYNNKNSQLCIYSVFPVDYETPLEQALHGDTYWLFYDLIFNHGYSVSIPVNFDYHPLVSIFVHCGDTSKIIGLPSIFGHSAVKVVEYSDKVKIKDYDIIYTPIIKQERMPYNLPYRYIDVSSFDEQYLCKALNTD